MKLWLPWRRKAPKPMKQIIILRKDLNMRKGKMVAQGAHASMKVTLENLRDKRVKEWLRGAFAKIAVSVDSEEELLDLYIEAKNQGFLVALIQDKGLTEFHGILTNTAIAIGPDIPEKLDELTGKLKLL